MDFVSFREVYLDSNATTQPLPEVRKVMVEILGVAFGNPSSSHSSGDRAREHLLLARESVAALIGADPSQFFFTSSGTESNNTVFYTVVNRLLQQRQKPARLVTTQVEHSSVLKMCAYLRQCGVEVIYLPVDRTGHISFADLEAAVGSGVDLVSVQWVNNETGVVQPIDRIGTYCRDRGVLFHTDAAQAIGKLSVDLSELPVDLLSFTGHKFHGPQGIGVLYAIDRGLICPIFHGGDQEHGLRAGTENVPGIVGLGEATRLRSERLEEVQERLRELRDRFETLILDTVPETEVNGDRENRVCNTSNLCFRGVDGQALVARLDMAGIRCSQSSACTNQRPEPSYVLRAMGLSEEEAYASVRFSFSELNTEEEIDYAVTQVAEICEQIRRFRAGRHVSADHKVGGFHAV